jgi:tyrosine-specific transport protein
MRLFSNINRVTRRHEPGSVTGAALLVAGTTVGAGILAMPAATQAREQHMLLGL